MHPLFFIGICVLIVLLLLVLLSTGGEEATTLINKSNGTFDEAAQAALERLAQPETATEHIQRGNIVRLNVLEGNMTGDMFGRVLNDFTRATEIAMETDELMPVGFLHDIMNLYDVTQPRAEGFAVAGGVAGDVFGGMFGGGFADGFAGGFTVGGAGGFDAAENDYINMQLEQFHNIVAIGVPNIALNETRARVVKAAAAPNKAAAVATALEPEYRSDSQNVHDTQLNGDLNATLTKLADGGPKGNAEISALIADCLEYCADKPLAVAAAQKMREGTPISTYNTTESYILAAVWKRCDHRLNAANRELMRSAVATALSDCTENGSLVCVNGRCSRLLGSLVLLDFDSTVGSALTFDAYKNQIYEETKEMFEREIDELSRSDDAAERELAKSYEDPSITANEDATNRFHAVLKQRVDELLTHYTNLSSREIEQLRRDCYVYVTI